MFQNESSIEWNQYRREHPHWFPDLSGLDLSEYDFVPIDKPSFNLEGANLIGATMPSFDRVETDGRQANLKGCMFDDTTRFAGDRYELSKLGGIFCPSPEFKVERTKIFISHARSDLPLIQDYINEMEKLGLQILCDEKEFLPGERLDSEISRNMRESEVIIIFYSANYQDRRWTTFERRRAKKLKTEAIGSNRQFPMVLFVRLDETDLPHEQKHRLAIVAYQREPSQVCQDIYRSILQRPLLNFHRPPQIASIGSISEENLSLLKKRIESYMIALRGRMPRLAVDPTIMKARERWPDNLYGYPTTRLIVYLRSSGCRWAISTIDGQIRLRTGCLDCEHSLAGSTFGKEISSDDYLKQFQLAISGIDFSVTPVICVYNEGNFFNETELPVGARLNILKTIASFPEIRSVIVESLPEYLKEKALLEMREILGDRDIEVGIGLESSNQVVRELCVNKSYTLEHFKSKVKMVKKYCKVLAYVLLKPSFLSEKEALYDTIATVKYAFENGVDIVSIEPINISEFNMSGVLNRNGQYRPCWLWTIVEAVLRGSEYGTVRLGGEQFAPKYEHHPFNCKECNQKFYEAFQEYNRTLNLNILRSLVCDCRADWEKYIEADTMPLLERIEMCLGLLETSSGVNRDKGLGTI